MIVYYKVDSVPVGDVTTYSIRQYTGSYMSQNEMLSIGCLPYSGNKPVEWLKVVNNLGNAEIPLVIVEKSDAEMEAELAAKALAEETAKYALAYQNPDLARCVTEYKTLMDQYGMPYDATIAQMYAKAAELQLTEAQMLGLDVQIKNINFNLELNLQWCDKYLGTNFTYTKLAAWEEMSKLIQYLPKK